MNDLQKYSTSRRGTIVGGLKHRLPAAVRWMVIIALAAWLPRIRAGDAAEDRLPGQERQIETFEQDFRERSLRVDWLGLFGGLPPEDLLLTENGLRIRLRKGNAGAVSGGVQLLAGVRGDFEITGTFEIVNVPHPGGGHGAGLSVSLSGTKGRAASLQRVRLRQEGDVYVAHRVSPRPDGVPVHQVDKFPAGSQLGRLRIQRRGTSLIYFASEGDDGPFQELFRTEFSGDDLRQVQFAGQNGEYPNQVEVLWKSVQVRADSFIRSPSSDFVDPTKFPGAIFWGCWLTAPAAVGAAWLFVLRRQTHYREVMHPAEILTEAGPGDGISIA